MKDQMAALSKGLRARPSQHLGNPNNAFNTHSPYGDDWEVMHLGPSYALPPPDAVLKDVFFKYQDERSPIPLPACGGKKKWFCFESIIEAAKLKREERAVYPTYESLGLPALAVTYRGAQKILYDQSWRGLQGSTDHSLKSMVLNGELAGFTVIPPIFSMWKIGNEQDSDLKKNSTGTQDIVDPSDKRKRIDGSSPNLKWSARKAMDGLIPRVTRWKLSPLPTTLR